MKPPHTALDDAAAIQLELAADEQASAKIITLGYRCAGWNFLVCHGVMAEVLSMPKISPVPRSPSHCWGICNIRGNITPVFDLSEKLTGQSDFQLRDNFYILLQGSSANRIGLVINQIPKSMQLEQGQLIGRSSHLPDGLNEYVQNVYRQGQDIWHELDVEGLLKAVQA
jgi:chemotaxis signal transduction protein